MCLPLGASVGVSAVLAIGCQWEGLMCSPLGVNGWVCSPTKSHSLGVILTPRLPISLLNFVLVLWGLTPICA